MGILQNKRSLTPKKLYRDIFLKFTFGIAYFKKVGLSSRFRTFFCLPYEHYVCFFNASICDKVIKHFVRGIFTGIWSLVGLFLLLTRSSVHTLIPAICQCQFLLYMVNILFILNIFGYSFTQLI